MLVAERVNIHYEDYLAVKDVNIKVNEGEILSIIGPNGSGKSTLLRAIGRIHKHSNGIVYLNGKDIRHIKSKKIAQQLCLLCQHQNLPPDMTVEEFVGRGRIPHKSLFSSLDEDDRIIVDWALRETKMTSYKDRSLFCLSGGERQRAFIAMALAQKPKILLLDEPTTYLDICHQFDVLNLVKNINKELGITVVMVLHDLNQASIFSDRIAVMNNGELHKIGTSKDIISTELIKDIYGIEVKICSDEATNKPYFIPIYNFAGGALNV